MAQSYDLPVDAGASERLPGGMSEGMDAAKELWSEFVWVWLVVLLLIAAAAAVTVRYWPRRGAWNQPAAEFAPPSKAVRWVMYGLAAAHLTLGFVAIIAADLGVLGALVVILVALFYVACGHAAAIARRLPQRTRR